MALDAGSVYTTLGGRLNTAAFKGFEAANQKAAATMNSTERAIASSQARVAASARRTARSVEAAAGEETAARKRAATAAETTSAETSAADGRRAASARRAARAKVTAAGEEAAAGRKASTALTEAAAQSVAAEKRKAAAAKAAATAQLSAARQSVGALSLIDRAQLGLYGRTRLTESANESTRKSFATLGSTIRGGALGIAAFGAVAVAKGVKGAAELEQQLNIFQAVSRASGRQMEAVSDKAVALGADLSLPATSASDATDAMVELAKGNMSVKQSMDASLGVLRLSAAANISNGDAAKYVVRTLSAFRMEASESTRVADLLAAAANASTVEIPQMGQALAQASAVAHQFNIPIDTTVGMLTQLANAGMEGSDSGTSLKVMLQALTPNSRKAAEAMDDLGIKVFDQAGRMRAMPDIIGQFQRGLGRLTDEQQATTMETIFGSDAVRAANIILGDTVKAHENAVRAVNRQGAAADMAAARMRGMKGAQEALNNAWETGTTIIGIALLPKLTELGNKAAAAMSRFAEGGGAARLGEDIADGFDIAVDVFSQVVAVGGDVARVLVDIGSALQLGDADVLLSLGAGFAAFKVAGVVAPMVISLASAINMLVLNARTASGVGAFLSGLNANPVMLAATGVGLLATGLVALHSTQESAADKARATAEAFKAEAEAMQALDDALLAAADAQFGAIHADRSLADAKKETSAALRRYGRDSQQYRSSLAAEREAGFRSVAAHERVAEERRRIAREERRSREEDARAVREAEEERDKKVGDATRDFFNPAGVHDQAEWQKKVTDAWREYDQAVQRAAAGSAKAAISSIQLNRLMQGQRLLTDANVTSIGKLARVYDQLPRRTQVQLATSSESALSDIGDLVGQLRNVPKSQTVQILAKANGAEAQIAALRATVLRLPPRRVIEILSKTSNAKVQIAALTAAVNGVPQKTITQILENGSVPARVKIAALTAAANGVPAKKVAQILENGSLSAKGKVDALRSAIDGLPPSRSSTITLTTVRRTIVETINKGGGFRGWATGRGAGASEVAVVGEGNRWQGAREAIVDRRTGAAFVVDRPTMMQLGPDHYVIPLEENRSPAVALMRMLAADLGVETFSGGRPAPAARASGARPRRSARRGGGRGRRSAPRKVPPKIAEGGVPFEDVERRYTSARDDYKRATDAVSSTRKQLDKAEWSLKQALKDGTRQKDGRWSNETTRENAKKRVDDLRKELRRNERTAAERKPLADKRKTEWRAAKKTNDKVKNLETDVNVARNAMEDADRVDDQGAFDKAKGRRLRALRDLLRVLQRAFNLSTPNTDYHRQLREKLSQLGGDAAVRGESTGLGGEIGQTEAEINDVDGPPDTPEQKAAERLADTGMTDAERARLQKIDTAISLARLTAGLDDDTGAASDKVSFLQQVLAAVQSDPARGGDASVQAIADDLVSAQENLKSLTGGGGTNSDSDLQAKVDQERQRADNAEAMARGYAREVAAFGSSGDIGSGGYGNAYAAGAGGAPQVVQHINTLHPGDPALLRQIGAATVAGIGYQAGRPSPRMRVGV